VTFSQTDSKNQIDLSGYLFVNNVFRFSEIEGAGHVDNGEGLRFGINYNRKILDKLWINSGLNYMRATNVYHGSIIGPMEPKIIQSQISELIQIPMRIRCDIRKWFYIKTGLTFDSQFNNKDGKYVDNQTGIGFSLLGGIDLSIFNLIHFDIEPEFGITSLIPFNADDYQQHFLLTGINFNIGYRF
jgi:hypothetical protein